MSSYAMVSGFMGTRSWERVPLVSREQVPHACFMTGGSILGQMAGGWTLRLCPLGPSSEEASLVSLRALAFRKHKGQKIPS